MVATLNPYTVYTMSSEVKVTKRYVRKLILDLNRYCFHAGSDRFAESLGVKELTPEIMKSVFESPKKRLEFGTHINWTNKEAQKIIIRNRLKIERAIKNEAINFEEPYNEHYIFALLRDYADMLAWNMLKHDISAIRNVFLGPKQSSPLDEQNWDSIERSLKHFNADPNQFALATDLTSFFQVGDLYCINFKTNEHHLVEVKTGAVNDKIIEAISAGNLEDFKQKSFEIMKQAKDPKKTSNQIERVLRQYVRGATTLKYRGYGSKKRTELRTGNNITIHEDRRTEESWVVAVRDVIKDMLENNQSYATGWVDYCLFFAYGMKPLTNLDEAFFKHRINQHFKYGLSEEEAQKIPIFRHSAMLGTSTLTPRSLLYSGLGMERQKKLLAGEEFLLVFLDIPALRHMLRQHGFDLRLRNMEQGDQPYNDQLMRKLFGPNKFPVVSTKIDGEEYDWTILSGTWSRIVFDFMAPIEVVNYSGTIIENSRKAKKDKQKKSNEKKKI